MAILKHQFEDLSVVFCDKILMVGSMKLLKINYRLQDLIDNSRKKRLYGRCVFCSIRRSMATSSYQNLIWSQKTTILMENLNLLLAIGKNISRYITSQRKWGAIQMNYFVKTPTPTPTQHNKTVGFDTKMTVQTTPPHRNFSATSRAARKLKFGTDIH